MQQSPQIVFNFRRFIWLKRLLDILDHAVLAIITASYTSIDEDSSASTILIIVYGLGILALRNYIQDELNVEDALQ